jgi:predicted GTPase
MGAAGRDFHVFNVAHRGNEENEVVAFTAAQIPWIDARVYPPSLSGPLYPEGIPIYAESELPRLLKQLAVDEVVFAYSDVSYQYLREREKLVREAGIDFRTFDITDTMVPSRRPVIAVCAVRTGAGKSPTSRRVVEILREAGREAVVIRHPMPYGQLDRQLVQRFASIDDMVRHECTIEEMEEYHHHLEQGTVVYAGVDYEQILRSAEQEADVIVWDGGNNDTPCIRPDLHITLVDPLRPGDEVTYFPGFDNLKLADVIVINKVDVATPEQLTTVRENIARHNSTANVLETLSPLQLDNPERISGKRVLVVEDGPTLTHGGMSYGAGLLAARRYGALEIVDPRPYASGTMAETFHRYPNTGPVLPATGYSKVQVLDLQESIERTPAEVVIIATPVDLGLIIHIQKPTVRVTYGIQERGGDVLRTSVEAATNGLTVMPNTEHP